MVSSKCKVQWSQGTLWVSPRTCARVRTGPSRPSEEAASPGDCSGEGKAQMKHLVSAYLVASCRIPQLGVQIACVVQGVCSRNRWVGGGSQSTGQHIPRTNLAPVEFAAQCLRPCHDEVAYAHWDAALDQHLVPVPSSPAPAATEFEPPALAVATGFPPEIARDP
jgi:hypothetical protein